MTDARMALLELIEKGADPIWSVSCWRLPASG
jgi:hypothetical protein